LQDSADAYDYATLLQVFQHGRVHAILQLGSNIGTLERDSQLRGEFRALDLTPRENVQGPMSPGRWPRLQPSG
jgi:polar amino acid transport system substrate-binding protein